LLRGSRNIVVVVVSVVVVVVVVVSVVIVVVVSVVVVVVVSVIVAAVIAAVVVAAVAVGFRGGIRGRGWRRVARLVPSNAGRIRGREGGRRRRVAVLVSVVLSSVAGRIFRILRGVVRRILGRVSHFSRRIVSVSWRRRRVGAGGHSKRAGNEESRDCEELHCHKLVSKRRNAVETDEMSVIEN
jgi:hypothetical protein